MNTKLNKFEKLLIATRYWLLGMAENDPAYFKVLEAMEYGLSHHDGLRNGGEHEFIHQLSIFAHVRTMHKQIKNPIIVYILIFLHDAVEDPNKKTGRMVSLEEVEQIWGEVISTKLRKLSKEILGQKNVDYSLDTIFEDEDCAVVKGGDRCNNVSTMYGVFKIARLERYVKETVEEFLDRIKGARRRFPSQEGIFENFKLELVNQLQLINHLIDLEAKDEPETERPA
jgi:(p)ppGpp synthase/HD superfamily hydrolase